MRRLLAALMVLACSGQGAKSPEAAVQLFIAAARGGDRAAIHQRLGPRTRARIQALQDGTRRTSGRLVTKAEDFLAAGWAPAAWEPAGTRTLREDGDRAEVEVYSAAGDRHALEVVKEGDEWKVELPGR
jgi:hypothetical protein